MNGGSRAIKKNSKRIPFVWRCWCEIPIHKHHQTSCRTVLGTSPFRDVPLPLVFSGTNLEKVKTGKFDYLRYCLEFREITYLPNKTTSSNFSNPFHRKDRVLVGDFIKAARHLFFNLGYKSLRALYNGQYFPYSRRILVWPSLMPADSCAAS